MDSAADHDAGDVSRPLGDILIDSARSPGPRRISRHSRTRSKRCARYGRSGSRARAVAGSFDDFWDQSLREGGRFAPPQFVQVKFQSNAFQKPIELPDPSDQSALTMVAYPHIFWYDGRGADKPWLQEIPEPVSQIVWDAWIEIHPDTAKRLEIAENDIVRAGRPARRYRVTRASHHRRASRGAGRADRPRSYQLTAVTPMGAAPIRGRCCRRIA